MITSDQTAELFTALAKASTEFKIAIFDKKAIYGPYASFKSVREASIEALNKNGLSIVQPVTFDGQFYVLNTQLSHSTGQFMRASIRLILDKNNMQGLGSAITYAKRYAWAALVGVVSDDDDDATIASNLPVDKPRKAHAAHAEPKMFREAKAKREADQKEFETYVTTAHSINDVPPMPDHMQARSTHSPPEDFTPADVFEVNPADYVIKHGKKYLDKKIKDVPPTELLNYVKWLEGEAEKSEKPLTGFAEEMVHFAKEYIRNG